MGLGHLHPECHNKCPKWKPEFGFDIPHQDDVQTGFPVQEDSQTEFPVQEDSQTEFPVQTDLVDHDNSHTDSPDRDSGQVEELDIIHQDDAQTELPVQEDSQIDLVDHGDSRTDSPDEDSDEVEVLDQLTSLLTLVPNGLSTALRKSTYYGFSNPRAALIKRRRQRSMCNGMQSK
jgi:hypothetical protein